MKSKAYICKENEEFEESKVIFVTTNIERAKKFVAKNPPNDDLYETRHNSYTETVLIT